MGEYDGDARPLPWPVRNPLVYSRTTETDPEHDGSVFVWPEDSDERVPIVFNLSLNEFVVLASAIDAGSDIAYGIDAIRVWWLWDRVLRVPTNICDAIINCINNNPATMAAIVDQLIVNTTFNEYLTQTSVADNIYPPRPTAATPNPLCNAATYCVSKLRELISNIYDDLETLDASEVLAGLLGLAGWRSSPLYQLIGLAETNDKTALLAAFDAAAPDLICDLIAEELDQEPILAWIAETYPPPSVLGDAFTYAIQSAADEGKWAQWIAVGATMTGATCDCGTPPTSVLQIEPYPGWEPYCAWTFIGLSGTDEIWEVESLAPGFENSFTGRSATSTYFYVMSETILEGAFTNVRETASPVVQTPAPFDSSILVTLYIGAFWLTLPAKMRVTLRPA